MRFMSAWVEALEREGAASFDSASRARAVAESLGRPSSTVTLKPRLADAGWSLSGAYGCAAFPWHTDAAVALRPPRWIVLSAVELEQPTMTEVLLPPPATLATLFRTTLRVRSRNGVLRYLPAVVRDHHGYRLRWDPRVAQPSTSDLLDQIENLSATSVIEWTCGRSVIIDNHRALHRRPAVSPGRRRTLTRYYVWEA